MIRHRSVAASLVMCLLVGTAITEATPVAQQPDVEGQLDHAKTQYRDGHFDEAVATLREVIVHLNQLQDLQRRKVKLADAHLLLGLTHLALRSEPEALENFRQVVMLDPGRTLDPEIFAPKALTLFDRARTEVGPTVAAPPEPAVNASGKAEAPLATPASSALSMGAMMRLHLSGSHGYISGSLVELTSESIRLRDSDNRVATYPRDMVTTAEVSAGRKNHLWLGTIIGAGFGVAVGALEEPGTDSTGEYWSRSDNIFAYSFGFGLMGALVGALYKTDEWVEVPIARGATASSRNRPRGTPIFTVSWD